MGVGSWELDLGFFDRLRDGLTPHEAADRQPLRGDRPAGRHRRAAHAAGRRRHDRGARGAADLGRRRHRRDRADRARRARARAGAARACAIWSRRRSGAIFDAVEQPRRPTAISPHVTLIVGVNGTGKTTTDRQAGQSAEGVGQAAADLRRRHVPRRGGRAARDLGEARATSTSCARRTDPIRRRSCSTRFSRARRADAIRFSSTPPAACTLAST